MNNKDNSPTIEQSLKMIEEKIKFEKKSTKIFILLIMVAGTFLTSKMQGRLKKNLNLKKQLRKLIKILIRKKKINL